MTGWGLGKVIFLPNLPGDYVKKKMVLNQNQSVPFNLSDQLSKGGENNG